MLELLMNKKKKYSNFSSTDSKSFLRSYKLFAPPTIRTTRDGSKLVFPSLFLDDQSSNLEFEKTKYTILGDVFAGCPT